MPSIFISSRMSCATPEGHYETDQCVISMRMVVGDHQPAFAYEPVRPAHVVVHAPRVAVQDRRLYAGPGDTERLSLTKAAARDLARGLSRWHRPRRSDRERRYSSSVIPDGIVVSI
jgi:hypothetical protein